MENIAGLVAFVCVFVLLSARKKSFISINEYSARYLKKYGKRYEFIRYGLVVALLVGIVAEIVGNKIYNMI
jgi:hypothetical protein